MGNNIYSQHNVAWSKWLIFADKILQILLKNVYILDLISLFFILHGPIKNKEILI